MHLEMAVCVTAVVFYRFHFTENQLKLCEACGLKHSQKTEGITMLLHASVLRWFWHVGAALCWMHFWCEYTRQAALLVV